MGWNQHSAAHLEHSFIVLQPAVVIKSAPGTAICQEIANFGLETPQPGLEQLLKINALEYLTSKLFWILFITS